MSTPKSPRKRGKNTDNAAGVSPEDAVTLPQAGAIAGDGPAADEIADAVVIADDSLAGILSGEDAPQEKPAEKTETDPDTEALAAPVQAETELMATAEPEHDETDAAETPGSAGSGEIVPDFPDSAEPERADNAPQSEAPETEKPSKAGNTATPRLHFEATQEAPPEPAPKPRSVFVPMLLGGAVAAGIGFGLAKYGVPEGWPIAQNGDAITALEARLTQSDAKLAENLTALRERDAKLSGNEAKLAENAREIADIKARLATLANAGPESTRPADLEALGAAAAKAIEAANDARRRVEGLEPRLAAVEQALTALQNRPTGDPSVDSAMIDRLSADMDAMRAEVSAQKAAADAAAARVAQEVALARAEAEAKAQTTLLRAAAAQVQAALQSGVPFAAPLAQLAAAGTEIPAPLPDLAKEGAPTVSALKDGFGEAARAALDVSRRENVGQSVTERLTSFLKTQTGARSLTPIEGDDPDAVLSRAEAALRNGDLPGALGLISTLPASAQTAMAGWVARANTLLSAQDAAATLSAALSER
tara:strand:- start:5820 stop:7427 length:1608 start_codon:yes stop_codon:yes gene_type:complete